MRQRRVRPVGACFGMLLRSVLSDGMLAALLLAPPLLGALLRFGLPALLAAVPALAVIDRYRALWDALLYLLTPCMALFASCMVALEERDNGVCLALLTTPLGKRGYLCSRFLLPALLAAVYTALIGVVFSSVARPAWHSALLALPAAATALVSVAPIPAFARDKIAGMAMGKLNGLILLTVAVPFFLPIQWQPLLCWLPTYWFYRFVMQSDWLMAVMCVGVSALWLMPMARAFAKRVVGR